MSRIGKKTIILPSQTSLSIADDRVVVVRGPKGTLEYRLPIEIDGQLKGNEFRLTCAVQGRKASAMHGLARALINNMVRGVNDGFSKELQIQGVGFKASVQADSLKLSLGFSHEIIYRIPGGVHITVTDGTRMRVEGIDRQLVGQTAADIRRFYPPEPYKGKGVRYVDEQIVRKEGKTVQ